MKKPTCKSKSEGKTRGKDRYTVAEAGTLIECLRSEFHVFGENQKGILKKLDATYKQVAKNTEDIAMLKIAVRDMVAKIEKLIKSIEQLVKTKLDREEFLTLEKRISTLEAKVASLTQ